MITYTYTKENSIDEVTGVPSEVYRQGVTLTENQLIPEYFLITMEEHLVTQVEICYRCSSAEPKSF